MFATRPMLVVLCILTTFGCDEGLYHDVDEQTANELVVALREAGVDAQKVVENRNGFTVEVPRGTTVRAMNALQERGLPRLPVHGFAATFQGDTLIPSPAEDRARLQHATAQEIRRSLLTIDGVLEAQVNVVLPTHRRGNEAEPRASVVLRWTGDAAPVSPDDVRGVVCGSVEGLSPGSVDVLMSETVARAPAAPELVTVGPITVHAAAKTTTQGVLAGLTAAILLLGALLVASVWRDRRPFRGFS